ncbi:MAG TPA: hypothetical protein VKT77_00950, partial [Chthonomonadaceae bacterium]|nr:hypothetical protein [Chthonomonadaceae bacterium]
DRNEGYMLDSRARDDVDDHPITSALLGSPSRYLWRYFVEPIVNKLFGEMKNRARRRVLAEYPTSLVCTHCHYILKRK